MSGKSWEVVLDLLVWWSLCWPWPGRRQRAGRCWRQSHVSRLSVHSACPSLLWSSLPSPCNTRQTTTGHTYSDLHHIIFSGSITPSMNTLCPLPVTHNNHHTCTIHSRSVFPNTYSQHASSNRMHANCHLASLCNTPPPTYHANVSHQLLPLSLFLR